MTCAASISPVRVFLGCDFTDALIDGARFDQAEIDRVGFETEIRTNLAAAKGLIDRMLRAAYAKAWKKPSTRVGDGHLPVGAVFRDAPFAPEMVVIPAGKFLMGSPEAEEGRSNSEGPQHEVTITKPLAVGRYP